jgi:hypothetical protein
MTSMITKVVASAASSCAILAVSPVVPAHAEATGTVAAQTQRSTAPNLASQDGTYAVGQKLTLICSTHGQKVKGHFSFNIAGGWDDLWYRTSDNHYVPDVDVETGTLDVVAADCSTLDPQGSGPAPQSAGAREDRAVAWANGKVGSDDYPILCGQFVANAYGKSNLGPPSAIAFHDQLAGAGQIHMDMNIPKGALVFSHSSWDTIDGVTYGHVLLARGDGTYVSGGVSPKFGSGHTVQVLNSWNPAGGAQYLGWAYAPADWPGV